MSITVEVMNAVTLPHVELKNFISKEMSTRVAGPCDYVEAVYEVTVRRYDDETRVEGSKSAIERLLKDLAAIKAGQMQPPDKGSVYSPWTKKPTGWIGVDLDGTLAHYDGYKVIAHIGAPIPKMVERVKKWLAEGREVRIVTARGNTGHYNEDKAALLCVRKWIDKHLDPCISIRHSKDHRMDELWDDRAIQVIKNTGERVDGKP